MLTEVVERRKNAPMAEVAGGYGRGNADPELAARNAQRGLEEVGTSTRGDWPVFVTFGIAMFSALIYAVMAVLGWVNWKAWLPIAVAAVFIAWISALRITGSDGGGRSPRR